MVWRRPLPSSSRDGLLVTVSSAICVHVCFARFPMPREIPWSTGGRYHRSNTCIRFEHVNETRMLTHFLSAPVGNICSRHLSLSSRPRCFLKNKPATATTTTDRPTERLSQERVLSARHELYPEGGIFRVCGFGCFPCLVFLLNVKSLRATYCCGTSLIYGDAVVDNCMMCRVFWPLPSPSTHWYKILPAVGLRMHAAPFIGVLGHARFRVTGSPTILRTWSCTAGFNYTGIFAYSYTYPSVHRLSSYCMLQ